MVRRWTADKDLDERTFRYTVDIPVPHGGLGRVLEQIVGWCSQHAGLWALHSHSAETGDFARFYFLDEEVAATFAQQWGQPGGGAPRRALGHGGSERRERNEPAAEPSGVEEGLPAAPPAFSTP